MSKTHQTRTPARPHAPVRPAPAVARTPARPHAVGNQALQHLLDTHAVQARLTVTPPTDAYEQEAERVADEVMRGSPTPDTPTPDVSAGAVSRAAKAETKDEKKKPDDQVKRAEAKKPEDDKKVKRAEAKKPEDDKTVKRMEAPEPQEAEEKVQRSADGSAVPDVSPELERTLNRQAGGGQQLSPEQRAFYEPRFGADLGNVRLHTDTEAAAAAKELRAEAFTRGSDVYFAAGKYQPQSDSGRHLIAHELTHTLQQSGGGPVQTKRAATGPGPLVSPAAVIQRAGNTVTAEDAPTVAGPQDPTAGEVRGKTIVFPEVKVPDFKLGEHRKPLYDVNLIRTASFERSTKPQREVWKQSVKTAKIEEKLKKIWEKNTQATDTDTPLFTAPGAPHRQPDRPQERPQERYFSGELSEVAREFTLPTWTKSGKPKSFDVDHVLELQLAGQNGVETANTLPNMELLDASANRSSGATIAADIAARLTKFHETNNADKRYGENEEKLKEKFNLKFTTPTPVPAKTPVTKDDFWQVKDIEAGDHITDDVVKLPDLKKLARKGMVAILPAGAGYKKQFKHSGEITTDEVDWLKPFKLTGKQFNTAPGDKNELGTLTYELPADDPKWESDGGPQTITIVRYNNAQYVGTMDRQQVRRTFRLRHKKLSPIRVDEFDILPTGGLSVSGQILLDTPVLRGAGVDFQLTGNVLTLSKTFRTTDFSLPKPFVARSCSLTLSASTSGRIGAEGQLDFGIERVGEGYLKALARLDQGFGLEGKFAFDKRVFSPAEFTLRYVDGKFSGQGTVGIPEGKLKGVKSATITVGYAADVLTASGSVELSIPGVRNAAVLVNYSEADGLTIKGNVSLADGIPGIRDGTAEAVVKRSPAGDWAVAATGTATPAIPGVNASLAVAYADGAITIQGRAGIARGMLKGEATLGATNRQLDADGHPTGPPGDDLTAFGSGSATVTFTPWLQGTVGLDIQPDGGMKLRGRVGVPSMVKLTPDETKVAKTLFSIGVDIPIIGVSILGKRIGVFATVSGKLAAEAGFGPAYISNLFAEVEYDPDHEELTRLSGHGEFHVPAHAGLSLTVSGGLGVGIPIVSAEAKLNVEAALGVKGEGYADADVNWTPETGLELSANVGVTARPQLEFKVYGDVTVEADLLLKTVELFYHRWDLAEFKFGPELEFGLNFPIRYNSRKPFDVRMEDVSFRVPDIDPVSVLRDLISAVT